MAGRDLVEELIQENEHNKMRAEAAEARRDELGVLILKTQHESAQHAREAQASAACAAQLSEQVKQLKSLLNRCLPELQETIVVVGDDHTVGLCCCDLINLAEEVSKAIK